MARGLNIAELLAMNKQLPLPDITFYLDVSGEEAVKRMTFRERLTQEEKNLNFLNCVRYNFLEQKWGKNENYFIMDGMDLPGKVSENIIKKLVEVCGII
jgi:thymidylate kinase